ncbi:hypothetical protein HK104_000109 [Borealophlyctis nickersoniae]|nr:hypothetical protein HK104_000109 [Borealophlyctis nickersoniae]
MEDEETEWAKRDPPHRINAVGTMGRVLSAMTEEDQSNASNTATTTKDGFPPTVPVTPSYVSLDKKAYTDAHDSTGAAAAPSLTSTAVPVQTRNVAATQQ